MKSSSSEDRPVRSMHSYGGFLLFVAFSKSTIEALFRLHESNNIKRSHMCLINFRLSSDSLPLVPSRDATVTELPALL